VYNTNGKEQSEKRVFDNIQSSGNLPPGVYEKSPDTERSGLLYEM
jgi:hypothetical protein